MITSKPLQGTIISFTLFLIFSYAIIGMSLLQLIYDTNPSWYVYLVVVIMTPLAIFLSIRTFVNYKVIGFGNNQISIRYTVRRKIKSYPLAEVAYWKESIVKTGKNSTFKEIEIQFADQFKINLGLKEFSDYPKVQAYLEKKLRKKKREET